MLAAREPKNGPQENKKTGNFKPVALGQFQTGVDTDLILSNTTPTTAALLQQTPTIPIIFAMVADPLGSGFVASFPKPGGNVTGFATIEGSLGGKWVELLREIAPRVGCDGGMADIFFWAPVSINIEKRCNHYRLIVACMLSG
jgi:hypothetical protein